MRAIVCMTALVCSVGHDGTLKFVGEEWTRGDYPRSFNFDPAGRFLYSCNQRDDNIAVFKVNRKTGGLTFTGTTRRLAIRPSSCFLTSPIRAQNFNQIDPANCTSLRIVWQIHRPPI